MCTLLMKTSVDRDSNCAGTRFEPHLSNLGSTLFPRPHTKFPNFQIDETLFRFEFWISRRTFWIRSTSILIPPSCSELTNIDSVPSNLIPFHLFFSSSLKIFYWTTFIQNPWMITFLLNILYFFCAESDLPNHSFDTYIPDLKEIL